MWKEQYAFIVAIDGLAIPTSWALDSLSFPVASEEGAFFHTF